jgi:hypothetical protein
VTPPTFTPDQADASSVSNTALPIPETYLKLEYSMTGTDGWTTFPTNAADATFFSDSDDTSCVSSFTSGTLAFSIHCTDNTKFAAAGTYDVYARYSLQWSQVES